jgi:glycosyltransferase involved in cell wall biosynthesis
MTNPTNRVSVEITLPVLDEGQTIEKQVRELDSFLRRNFSNEYDISVIIADNGSTDDTGRICERLVAGLRGFSYVRFEQPGVGAALRPVWLESRAQIVGYMDLDFSTDLLHIKDALEHFKDPAVQVVVGSRLLPGARAIGRTPVRNATSRVLNQIIKFVFSSKQSSDVMCGFKFLTQDSAVKVINAGANNKGWFFGAEILIWSEELSLKIIEIPVKWTDSAESKVRIMRLSARYLRDIGKNFFAIQKHRKNLVGH